MIVEDNPSQAFCAQEIIEATTASVTNFNGVAILAISSVFPWLIVCLKRLVTNTVVHAIIECIHHFILNTNASMMSLFIINFGGTLDELGQAPGPDEEAGNIQDSVATLVQSFVIFGAIAMFAGFAMVSAWSIAGERQVRVP